MIEQMHDILGPQGPFAHAVSGFQPRSQQQAMAEAVAAAIAEYGTLIAEAGTGTGKTYAYLVPALLSGKKVIVSTGTRNLQDQLFHRDLPMVRSALNVPVSVALLKGRANYLCQHRLRMAELEGRFATREMVDQFQRVRSWAGRTQAGDIAEVNDVAEDSPLWPLVTSNADNCLGGECLDLNECHVAKARRAAQEAELVVINHHLLFADMALKEDGFGELLPTAEAYIIDEAHQLPEVASTFFGVSVGGRQLLELARDSVLEHQREAGDMPELVKAAETLEYRVRDLRLAFGNEGRRLWNEVRTEAKVVTAFTEMGEALSALHELLSAAAPRGKGLENCCDRAELLQARLTQFGEPAISEQIYWLEIYPRTFTLNATPLAVAEPFQRFMAMRKAAWIFTSATLAVKDDFSHYARQLGLEAAATAKWDSPFDYARNALLYVPPDMPEPNSADYTDAVIEAALPVVEASRGRAFLLFTSHRALKRAAEVLTGRCDYPLLVQGSAPKSELLRQFRELGNAVLLGTGSFWEGVDVRGEALSCVVIDKLPFAMPDDPVLQARVQAIEKQGGNAFRDHQLPTAVISLKQGVGRLIRDAQDRGVMMLCDPRLISRSYGKVFLDSLPPMRRTRRLDRVQQFFTRVEQSLNIAAG